MLRIDGSAGEGGGQVLRTALGLSLVTQQPFRIVNIRGRRPKPGLLRQHLTCVRAAAAVGRAEVEGDTLGASELIFRPRALVAGAYEFAIGSAGSTTLVLQSILPGLLRAEGTTTLTIEGGTHNGLAPPYEFLSRSFLPLLSKMGAQVEVSLLRPGFEPGGGGQLEVKVAPAALKPLELLERGALLHRDAVATVCGLPVKVARRELAVVREELGFLDEHLRVEEVSSPGPGNALVLTLQYEQVTCVFVGLGARGIAAETVALRACREVQRELRTEAPVGLHLADQLLIPLALAGGGTFRTVEPTEHTRTQLELIPQFLDVKLGCVQERNGTWRIAVARS